MFHQFSQFEPVDPKLFRPIEFKAEREKKNIFLALKNCKSPGNDQSNNKKLKI